MTCHIATDARGCMLRHAHARHHRDGLQCLDCKTGISRMSRSVECPSASAQVAQHKPRRRGRPRKTPSLETVFAPTPSMIMPDTVRQATRDALHLAEACALGLGLLAERCKTDVALVREVLESAGLTIFKNECVFQGRPQPCVSVNKKLRSWAA